MTIPAFSGSFLSIWVDSCKSNRMNSVQYPQCAPTRTARERTDSDGVPNQVRVERVECARTMWETEAEALELFAEEAARLAVDLDDRHP